MCPLMSNIWLCAAGERRDILFDLAPSLTMAIAPSTDYLSPVTSLSTAPSDTSMPTNMERKESVGEKEDVYLTPAISVVEAIDSSHTLQPQVSTPDTSPMEGVVWAIDAVFGDIMFCLNGEERMLCSHCSSHSPA